ncbi:MAG: hypothetical protein KC441_01120 [Anaerolineales bacterium]|nr:hypothetical protein [Anaerolineales bacterium]
MLVRLSNRFYAAASGWLIVLILVVFVAFVAVTLPKVTAVSGNIEGLDTRFFYTPEEAFANVAAYSSAARQALNTFHLTVDIVNPILYTAFLVLLLSWLFRAGFPTESKMRTLNLIPLGALLFDILENIFITVMMAAYPAKPVWAAWLATVSTVAKFSFIYASLGLVLVGVAGVVLHKINNSRVQSAPAAEREIS